MLIFLYGGSGSGKSAMAERLLQAFASDEGNYYIATMWPGDGEARKRIQRHQAMRAGKGFRTVERYTALEKLTLPQGCSALLECVGNLAANEMFAPEGAGEPAQAAVLSGVAALRARAAHLILVSNDVGRDGTVYPPETQAYQLLMGELNRRLCAESDLAVEMVCGLPIVLKGGELWPFGAP